MQKLANERVPWSTWVLPSSRIHEGAAATAAAHLNALVSPNRLRTQHAHARFCSLRAYVDGATALTRPRAGAIAAAGGSDRIAVGQAVGERKIHNSRGDPRYLIVSAPTACATRLDRWQR